MKTGFVLSSFLVLTSVTACGPAAIPTRAATSTAFLANTTAPLPTRTMTLTATPVPTPIGGAEPKIAFVGEEIKGHFSVYVDGLFTGQPESIAALSLPELEARFLPMKWAPDGEHLVFWNRNEDGTERIFVYDALTRTLRDVGAVPAGKGAIGIIDFAWSSDGAAVHVVMGYNDTAPKQVVYWKLDLSSGKVSETDENFDVGGNSHVHSGLQCPDPVSLPKPFSDLAKRGAGSNGQDRVFYDRVCFYPEFDAFGGLRHGQSTTDLVLFSKEGQVNRILARFPTGFHAAGPIDLRLSPDKTQVLIVGEGGDSPDWPFASRSIGGQFSYAVPLDKLPLNASDPAVFTTWKHIHAVFGWSPDGMDYLIAESTTNYQTMKSDDRFEIVRADSGAVLFRYRVLNDITPILFVGTGVGDFDMVWPVSP